MRNAGNKRLTLLLVALAMLACGVMALGGTFAIGVNKSDEVNNTYLADNVLNYNVQLTYYGEDDKEYTSSLLEFSPFSNVLWCPGYTEIVYLKLTNNEKFPVECELDIIVEESGFGKMMSYAVIYGLKPNAEEHPKNWTEFKQKANISNILDRNPLYTSARPSYDVTKQVLVETGDQSARYYALAIHMDENATNEYQKESMKLSFNLRVNADYKPGATPATK